MFCPKCGTQAIPGTKFCRSCGTDLEIVSSALTGKLVVPSQKKLRKSRKDDDEDVNTNDPDKLWNIFITNSLTGLAFIAIAIFLTVTGTIGGHVWGFWLLIPGAGSLGRGISSYFRIRRIERTRAEFSALASASSPLPLFPREANPVLSPQIANNFADLYAPPAAHNTGELSMPPTSVTEGTTRHLRMDSESETSNLPNRN